MNPRSRRSLLTTCALALSAGLAGCSSLSSTTNQTPSGTTVTPAPVPTDDPTPTETPTSTPTATPESLWLHLRATPVTETELKAALFWELDELNAANSDLAASILEVGTVEHSAKDSSVLGPVTFVENDETYYRIERTDVAEPAPLEFAIGFTVVSCPEYEGEYPGVENVEPAPLSSLSAADQRILPEKFFSYDSDGRCGSFTFWHEFESHEAADESVFTASEPFYLSHKEEVIRVSSEPAKYAMKYPRYRYTVAAQSDSPADFELPDSVVANVDLSSLYSPEQEHLKTLLEAGHLRVEDESENSVGVSHLINRLTRGDQQGPEKLFYFTAEESYYEFDFWYTQW
ncbi:hypothetical protein ACFQH3_01835 [Haladaptatus sp. GCM10025707]|uniref:hypothetical protein n=1 Tax=unclassified Haladaptatus TaxID=2622732 RepID=UPI0023E7BD35|nr:MULTISPECIES: hypothetical protein [unclassified Haladaptatus]